ncbi:MAG: heme-binding protein [Candidatus Brocadiaceae bacterium]|nr:heme-binding protein [Candidatus Brocadiaceae bacterium]
MKILQMIFYNSFVTLFILILFSSLSFANALPSHSELKESLSAVVKEDNGGFGFHMWATIVDRDGIVKAVVFSGNNRGDQWPGSRIISAQKANTANAFSLPGFALSTANLFSAVQPGGSLFGLQFSNPVLPKVAYRGSPKKYGTEMDPMVGDKIGGVNVFGGGLALYNSNGDLLGALGVSGDSSCADHTIAWKVRHKLQLDYVPHGVSPFQNDNILYDIVDGVSSSGWGHPGCSPKVVEIGSALPATHPTRVRKQNRQND